MGEIDIEMSRSETPSKVKDYTSANWRGFSNFISSNISADTSLNDTSEIDVAINILTTCTLEADLNIFLGNK